MVSAALYYTVALRVSDPAFHCNADPDSDPVLHFNEDPDPAPHQGDKNLQSLPSELTGLHFEPLGLYCEHPRPSKALI